MSRAAQRKLRPIAGALDTFALPPGHYWIQTDDGKLGFRLTISNGPHGLGMQIDPFVGTPDVEVMSRSRNLELCQYQQTSTAQAYRRWYLNRETDEDIEMLGPSYRRVRDL